MYYQAWLQLKQEANRRDRQGRRGFCLAPIHCIRLVGSCNPRHGCVLETLPLHRSEPPLVIPLKDKTWMPFMHLIRRLAFVSLHVILQSIYPFLSNSFVLAFHAANPGPLSRVTFSPQSCKMTLPTWRYFRSAYDSPNLFAWLPDISSTTSPTTMT